MFSSNELRTTSSPGFAAVASRSGASRHEMCSARQLHSTGFRDGLLVRVCAKVLPRMRHTSEGGEILYSLAILSVGLSSRGDYGFSWNCARARRIRGIITTGNVARFISEIMVQQNGSQR